MPIFRAGPQCDLGRRFLCISEPGDRCTFDAKCTEARIDPNRPSDGNYRRDNFRFAGATPLMPMAYDRREILKKDIADRHSPNPARFRVSLISSHKSTCAGCAGSFSTADTPPAEGVEEMPFIRGRRARPHRRCNNDRRQGELSPQPLPLGGSDNGGRSGRHQHCFPSGAAERTDHWPDRKGLRSCPSREVPQIAAR